MKVDLRSVGVRVACSVLVSALVLFGLSRLRVTLPRHDPPAVSKAPVVPLAPIYEGVTFAQEFVAADDGIVSLSLLLATFGRTNPGALTLQVDKLRRGRWQELASVKVEKALLVDNQKYAFEFDPPLPVRVGDVVALRLTADGPESSSITWWTRPQESPDYRLSVNDGVVPFTAVFDVSYRGYVGKAGGRLMRGRLWRRITILLDGAGQTALVFGALLSLFSMTYLLLTPRDDTPDVSPGSKEH